MTANHSQNWRRIINFLKLQHCMQSGADVRWRITKRWNIPFESSSKVLKLFADLNYLYGGFLCQNCSEFSAATKSLIALHLMAECLKPQILFDKRWSVESATSRWNIFTRSSRLAQKFSGSDAILPLWFLRNDVLRENKFYILWNSISLNAQLLLCLISFAFNATRFIKLQSSCLMKSSNFSLMFPSLIAESFDNIKWS